MTILIRSTVWVTGWIVSLALVGCGSKPPYRVPVEDRLPPTVRPVAPNDPRTQPVKQPPGFENAGKAGYYTVKPGDTLIRIGLDNGQSHKDIARWNNLENPNRIEVGQVLRVIPPSPEVAIAKPVTPAVVTTSTLPAAGASSNTKPVAQSKPTTTASSNASAAPSQPIANGTASTPNATQTAANTASSSATSQTAEPANNAAGASNDEDLGWMWPSKGPVLAGFEEPKNKGVDIGGAAGDPVVAAADGKVVYAGSGLRGYGNLVILKHNATYLTAYAHNQSLAVKEDQTVKKGQKIAEMGSTDAERVQLHFEVRRQGRPVDPMKYLPAR